MKDIRAEKWETCRGMGHGFGFNREEQDADYIQLPDLIRMLVDIVSKNGNLLLNVGPMADGTIPEVQAELLRGVGRWLKTYGEAIYGTRPWQRAEGTTTTGGSVRFTRRADEHDTIYAVFMDPLRAGPVTIKDLRVADTATARDLATGKPVALRQDGGGLTFVFADAPPSVPAHAVAIHQKRELPEHGEIPLGKLSVTTTTDIGGVMQRLGRPVCEGARHEKRRE